ncbi:methyltransferase domain-containing protein [Planctobacterium marinum]|uniref:methyltransferase domain-containing protein n=1 Tax=Planctobacterium marinum TaxID=1631968 RepID=UPI001E3F2CE9|nr:methyltransferase domain-containing protein [Planctobacterium marinum]MCC2607325.1 methyltransferase domain-containing protein [Planctobacterium marinum]
MLMANGTQSDCCAEATFQENEVISTPVNNAESASVKQAIACRFGEAAAQYDSHALIQREIADYALTLTGKHCNRGCTQAIDIGCATGTYTRRLVPFAQQVVGLDLSEGMIKYAKAQSDNSAIRWAVADAEALPLADNCVDLLYSSMALQWLNSPVRVAGESFRVMSQQGGGVIAVVVDGSLMELNDSWNCLSQPSPVNHFMTADVWHQAFTAAGFKVTIQQQAFTSWHSNIFEVLHSIKDIGAGVVLNSQNQGRLNKRKLTTLNEQYQKSFAVNGRFPLTWQIAFLSFCKP